MVNLVTCLTVGLLLTVTRLVAEPWFNAGRALNSSVRQSGTARPMGHGRRKRCRPVSVSSIEIILFLGLVMNLA